MVPLLFLAGVAFAYWVALPRAVDFLQNFNDDQFDILIQAKDYYRFVIVFLALMGLVFQIPVGVLALTRTGVVTARGLWHQQGYAILGISIVAAVATPDAGPRDDARDDAAAGAPLRLSIGLAWVFRLTRRQRPRTLGCSLGRRGRRGRGPRRRRRFAGRHARPRTRAADAAVDPARVS